MGLFDILSNPELQKAFTSLAGKAQATLQETLQSVQNGGWKDSLEKGVKNLGNSVPQGTGGLVGAGALGALLGSVMPKAGTAAGMLGLGAVAWSFYRKWASENGINQAESQQGLMNPADPATTLMLRAMVYAARADGKIDSIEEQRIGQIVSKLCPGADPKILSRFMDEPIDPAVIARDVTSQDQAEDVYRLSCIIIDIDHFLEESYLSALASALGVSSERAAALREEAKKVKENLARLA